MGVFDTEMALSPVFGTKFQNNLERCLLRFGVGRSDVGDFQAKNHAVAMVGLVENQRIARPSMDFALRHAVRQRPGHGE